MPIPRCGHRLLRSHPGEDCLLRAVQRGSLDLRSLGVRAHLLLCARCRQAAALAEGRLLRVAEAFKPQPDRLCESREASRQRLLLSMRDAAAAQAPEQRRLPFSLAEIFAQRVTIFAALSAASLCIVILLSSARPHVRREESAEAILARASALEAATHLDRQPGVVLQKIAVHTGGRTLQWPVYRDRQLLRKARFPTKSSQEAHLLQQMAMAGVSRSDPLSIAAFEQWRKGLKRRVDVIVRPSAGLVTVETSVPSGAKGPVREESLTLRSKDYHPLERTIVFQDEERIELAELEYRVVDWSEAGKDWFEPVARLATRSTTPAVAPLPPTHVLTEAQLDLAEVRTRIALGRSNAEESEQIEIARTPTGVEVRGLAQSSERRQELQAALAGIPHVSSRIQTPADLDGAAGSGTGPAPASALKLQEEVSQPSPLLLYWRDLHRSPESADALSVQLLDCALRVRQQTHLLQGLSRKFQNEDALDAVTRAALRTLHDDHDEKLRSALGQCGSLMSEFPAGASSDVHSIPGPPNPTWEQMDGAAAREMDLVRDLTSGSGASRLDAPHLAIEIQQGIGELSSMLKQEAPATASGAATDPPQVKRP